MHKKDQAGERPDAEPDHDWEIDFRVAEARSGYPEEVWSSDEGRESGRLCQAAPDFPEDFFPADGDDLPDASGSVDELGGDRNPSDGEVVDRFWRGEWPVQGGDQAFGGQSVPGFVGEPMDFSDNLTDLHEYHEGPPGFGEDACGADSGPWCFGEEGCGSDGGPWYFGEEPLSFGEAFGNQDREFPDPGEEALEWAAPEPLEEVPPVEWIDVPPDD
jgi:hypothetical protein